MGGLEQYIVFAYYHIYICKPFLFRLLQYVKMCSFFALDPFPVCTKFSGIQYGIWKFYYASIRYSAVNKLEEMKCKINHNP